MEIEDFAYNSAIFGVAANLIFLLTIGIIATHFASLIKNTPFYIAFFLFLNFGISVSFALDALRKRLFCYDVKDLWVIKFEKWALATGTTIYLLILAMILLEFAGVYPFSLLGIPPLPVSIMVVVSSIPVATTLTARLIYINELAQGE
ncbi:MAG: hypothetical protein RXQ94_02425 [Caldivirga sp.]